ncbi:MAG: imidazolonepropionase [Chloroflexi bacterium]|nr:imidazolonepropionase [Chloroflexota bacterium]
MLDANFALYNVDRLVTVAPGCHPAARGELGVIERAALAAQDETIVWVGPMAELEGSVRLAPGATVLNTHGRTVLPGFVDPHTHPVFAGDRTGDFYARALGESYRRQMEGGIMHTVRQTRSKSEDTLLDLAYQRADTFLRYGTTTIQAKTGYGLSQQDELKSLRVLNRLQNIHLLKVVPAFLGAHVVPADFDGGADAYVDQIVDHWLLDARDRALFVDVWCDDGAFTAEQCRRILARARDLGFQLCAHANELGHGPGARLAAEMGARSVDHAVYLEDGDIAALRDSGTVAVLLPGTTFFLGSDRYAPARRLIDAGVTVALGTDYNPGTSFTQNMQFILTLAVLRLKMTAEEAIKGATLHAARAIGLDDRVGSLEPGKYCDLAVYCVGDYREIPYFYAMNLVESVVARGEIVVRDGQTATLPRPLARSS